MTLHKKSKVKSETCKRMSDDVVNYVDGTQESATASLQSVHKKQHINQIVDANQTCIEVEFERAVSTDICCSYDTGLEMVIADFFHCENIPDNVETLYWFKKMLQQALLVGKDFEFPDRRKIGGIFFSFLYFLFNCNNKSFIDFFQVYYLHLRKK